MPELSDTDESPKFEADTDKDPTLRQRFIQMPGIDGKITMIPVEPPQLPSAEKIRDLHDKHCLSNLEGQKPMELPFRLPSAFDSFIYQIITEQGEEYAQSIYRGLVEAGIQLGVTLNINPIGAARVIKYRMFCTKGRGICIAEGSYWNEFLANTEKMLTNLCRHHAQKKRSNAPSNSKIERTTSSTSRLIQGVIPPGTPKKTQQN